MGQAKPIVVIRPVPEGFEVTVEPPLSDGAERTLTFCDKSNAWKYAQGLWTEHRLGLSDLTVGNALPVGASRGPRGPYRPRRFF